MTNNLTYDFNDAKIKDIIEDLFYQKIGQAIGKRNISISIVTGPNWKRHTDNLYKYFNFKRVALYEVQDQIFVDLHNRVNDDKVRLKHACISNASSIFIDCDLTAHSDIPIIKKTLGNQIMYQVTQHSKAFIFTYSLRGKRPRSIPSSTTKVLSMLGMHVSGVYSEKLILNLGQHQWIREVPLKCHNKGRVREYKLYKYNAGGGPMLTCMVIYK